MLREDEEGFQYWLSHMDDALDAFLKGLPKEVREGCDYSAGSLDVLEGFLLSKYPSVDAIKGPSEAEFIDGVSRYLGETYRKSLGGRWLIEYHNPNEINFGLPVLELPGWEIRFCPLRSVTVARNRGTGLFWSTILKNSIEDLKS